MRGTVLTLLTLGAMLGVTSGAAAHQGSTKYLSVEVTEGGARTTVEVEDVDVAISLGLGTELAQDDVSTHDALIRSWLTRGITLRAGESSCVASSTSLALRERHGERPIVEAAIDYACDSEGALVLRDDTVFGDDSQHETLVRVTAFGETSSHVLRDGTRELELPHAPVSMLATAGEFIVEGAHHLAIGYDHLLFLLSLLFAAGAVSKKRGLRGAMKDASILVTAFTVGHSVTLVLASLDLVSIPSRIVEAAIAGSVVVAAAINVMKPNDEATRPWLALVFGLIHGFGFSSVLGELGLPSAHRAIALGSFNVGIELAQMAFVVTLLPVLAYLAKRPSYTRLVMQGGSFAIACCGCFWLVERVL